MRIKNSITKSKSRSNVESDLLISNTDSVNIISPLTNIGSISFVIEKKANTGRLFTKGATTLDVSDITGTDLNSKKVVVLTNGRLWIDGNDVGALVKDWTVAGDFIIGNGGGSLENFTISHVCFYRTGISLSELEINYLYQTGGLVPESMQENCFPHYPLTERYAFKADAAFIVKHPQFIVGDNVFFDVSEQYNYARPNWNVDALSTWSLGGGFSVVSEQLTYDGTQGGSRVASDLINNLISGDFQWIRVRFNVVSLSVAGKFWVFVGGTTTSTYRVEINAIGFYDIWLYYESGQASLFFSNTNGVILDLTAVWTVDQVNVTSALNPNHAKSVNFTDAELGTGGDVRAQSVKKEFYPPKGTNIWYNGGGDPDPANMTEIESGFIPILQGLLIETGISIGDTYTSIVGMGFTIQLLADIAALSDIITGLPSITRFRINGVEVANEAALIAGINNNNLCHVDLEWASASPTITFVHSGEDYYLIRDYYLDSLLSQKEAKRLTNNTLLSNPSVGLFQNKFNYYSLHNEGNYVAGVTNPENVPLIDVAILGNRESLGWTGGDAVTKLADLVTNLSDVEQLR